MNGDTGTGDFSGLSREQLLELVAAQQSQIRSQQQQQQQQQLQQQQLHHQQQLQQQQQQQLAWLGQSQRLNAGGNFFPHQGLGGPGLGGQGLGGPALGGQGLGGQGLGAGAGSLANLGAFGGLGAADLSHYPAAANPAAPGGLADLLRQQRATSERKIPSATEMLQQAQAHAQDPLGSDAFTSEHLLAGSTRRLPGVKDPPAAEEGLDSSKPPGGKQAKKASAAAAKAAAAAKKKTKRPLSAYNIYFKEEHAKIIALKEREKAERDARGEPVVSSDDDYSVEEDEHGNKTGKRRKRQLSTNQPGKRGKRQVDFENLTKVIGKRWKELPKERIEEYKRRAEEAMQAYRKNLFQKIRNSVKEDQG